MPLNEDIRAKYGFLFVSPRHRYRRRLFRPMHGLTFRRAEKLRANFMVVTPGLLTVVHTIAVVEPDGVAMAPTMPPTPATDTAVRGDGPNRRGGYGTNGKRKRYEDIVGDVLGGGQARRCY